jgi:hypothetical protein
MTIDQDSSKQKLIFSIFAGDFHILTVGKEKT